MNENENDSKTSAVFNISYNIYHAHFDSDARAISSILSKPLREKEVIQKILEKNELELAIL